MTKKSNSKTSKNQKKQNQLLLCHLSLPAMAHDAAQWFVATRL